MLFPHTLQSQLGLYNRLSSSVPLVLVDGCAAPVDVFFHRLLSEMSCFVTWKTQTIWCRDPNFAGQRDIAV